MDETQRDQQKRKIPDTMIEDCPEYRSVMVGPPVGSSGFGTAASPLPFPSKSFASMKPPSLMTSSYGSKQPHLARSGSNEKKFSSSISVNTSASSLSAASSVVPSNPINSIASSRWKINKDLEEVPTNYSLVRTNVYIKDCNPQEIADKICTTLKSLSITAIDNDDSNTDFDDREALFEGEKNILLAETQYGMKFAIRLFKGYDHDKNQMIVVEVKRTAGCSLEFRDTARSIIRSVKKSDNNATPKAPKSFAIPSFLPKRSVEDQQKCIEDDVNNCCRNLLSSTKQDSHLLALDSMERLTANNSNRNFAARCVLGHCDCLCRLIIGEEQEENFVCKSTTSGTSAESCNRHESIPSAAAAAAPSSSNLVRRKVLTILANSFDAISGSTEEEFDTILSKNENGTSDLIKSKSFLSLLLTCIEEASACPHDAYQAVRCLRYLVTISSTKETVSSLIREMNGMDVIIGSNGFANCFHDGLERESNVLISQLEKNNIINSNSSNAVC